MCTNNCQPFTIYAEGKWGGVLVIICVPKVCCGRKNNVVFNVAFPVIAQNAFSGSCGNHVSSYEQVWENYHIKKIGIKDV